MKSFQLSHNEANLLVPVYLHSKLHYLFSSTCCTHKECNISEFFGLIITSKLGFNSKMKTEIFILATPIVTQDFLSLGTYRELPISIIF